MPKQKSLKVAELKAKFSNVLAMVEKGNEVIIEYGKQNKKIAVIIPYKNYQKTTRKIGILEGKAGYTISKDFKITDEQLFSN